MAYIGRKPTNAPLTSADIQNGTITNDDLASGVAVANIGYTPANVASLSTVATSGSYNDLSNKPTIPTVPTAVSSFTNDSGYLTSYTETDPVFVASPAHGITETNKTNWNAAYGWGNHASAGYLTTTNAASTYQTQSGMSSYLTTATAASTYVDNTTFVNTLDGYVSGSAAASIYQTQSAMSGYLQKAGGNMTGAIHEKKASVDATNFDVNAANFFSRTITGAITFTVSNVPTTGTTASFIVDLTNGGAGTITWWSGVKWAGGTAPTLTASGRDVLGFFTHDGGTTWTGLVLGKDVK